MTDPPLILTPAQVAERLELSPAALRRLAVTYEEVHGPLPRPPGSPTRLWPLPAVEAVETARVMVAEGQAQSIQRALEQLAHPDGVPAAPPVLAPPALEGADPAQLLDAVAALVNQVRLLHVEQEQQAREIAELRALVAQEGRLTRAAVSAALTAPSDAHAVPRGLWARVVSLLRGRTR